MMLSEDVACKLERAIAKEEAAKAAQTPQKPPSYPGTGAVGQEPSHLASGIDLDGTGGSI
jgi:hypothetical protein